VVNRADPRKLEGLITREHVFRKYREIED
jgi:hypothetical protein